MRMPGWGIDSQPSIWIVTEAAAVRPQPVARRPPYQFTRIINCPNRPPGSNVLLVS